MDTSFRERCIALRKEGCSILEIMRATGRPKTSVYAHIHDLPLSEERVKEIRKASGKRIRVFGSARKGTSARPFVRFEEWNAESVLLVAHLSFDGGLGHGKCEYNNRSESLIDRVEGLMRPVYGFEPKRYRNLATGVQRISYFNVPLALYFKEKSDGLLLQISEMPLDLKREFLRAFFDDEGCMDFRPLRNHRRIRGYQKKTRVLYIVQGLLKDFGIDAHVKKPNEVVIHGKENLIRFQKEINFSPGVRINGNRSNSIWKESLEKRELLQRAIDSFRS